MKKSHAAFLMWFTTTAYWVVGPLLAAYDCWNLTDALVLNWGLFFFAATRAMGWVAIPWGAAMLMFAALWAISPEDKIQSPFEL